MLKTLKKLTKEILWQLPINTKFCLTNLDALGFPKGVPLMNNNLFDHEQRKKVLRSEFSLAVRIWQIERKEEHDNS